MLPVPLLPLKIPLPEPEIAIEPVAVTATFPPGALTVLLTSVAPLLRLKLRTVTAMSPPAPRPWLTLVKLALWSSVNEGAERLSRPPVPIPPDNSEAVEVLRALGAPSRVTDPVAVTV